MLKLVAGILVACIQINRSFLLRHGPVHDYGYYMQVYENPLTVKIILSQIRSADPTAPIFIISDGGLDYTKMAKQYSAHFTLAGHNQAKNHNLMYQPSELLEDKGNYGNGVQYLFRMGKAMRSCNCKFLVVMEEDTCMHHAPQIAPKGDVGGVPWNDMNNFVDLESFLEEHHINEPKRPWGRVTGACGGSYYKVSSMLSLPEINNGTTSDIFRQLVQESDDMLGINLGVDLMGPALAYITGRNVVPWEEVSEQGRVFDGSSGPKPLDPSATTAFEHKCEQLLSMRNAGGELQPSDAWMVRKLSKEELDQLPPDGGEFTL